jgi:hypothetical protein
VTLSLLWSEACSTHFSCQTVLLVAHPTVRDSTGRHRDIALETQENVTRTTRLILSALAIGAAPGCSRSADQADKRHFDSLLAARDTILGRRQALRDSLTIIIDSSVAADLHSSPTPVRSDADLRERPVVVPPAPVSPPAARQSAAGGALAVSPAAGARVAGTPATSPPGKINALPSVTPNPMTQRAIARGDSIARAAAAQLVGGGATSVGGDSVRGIIEIRGDAPRVVLKTADRRTVNLSGIATEGIEELGGADVVVRGLKISTQDIVVKSYVVRSMKGVPAYDGRLEQSGAGWILTLTDNRGVMKLSAVPPLLQQAVGARVWITTAPNSNVPVMYGMIVRR